MPAKGTRKLPDRLKVELVIAKELKPVGTATNATLAEQFDVAESTVRGYSYDNLTQPQKDLYAEIVAELKPDAAKVTSKALRKSLELMEVAETARDLAGVVAAGKFGYEVHRLENDKSTQNIAVIAQKDAAIEFIQTCVKHGFSLERTQEALTEWSEVGPEAKREAWELVTVFIKKDLE